MEVKEKDKKARALKYALSLIAFQDIGIGPDKNLGIVREISAGIQHLCKDETGIELPNSYPIDFVKENKEEVMKLLPFTLVELAKVKKEGDE